MMEPPAALSEEIRNSYRPRIVDPKISEKLSAMGGVLITGPRSCGKSWTGLIHSRSAAYLGDEDTNNLITMNPQFALDGEHPRLIDEWQDVPKLWDLARRNIDLNHKKGMYIFTGSSVHPFGKTFHTGIGRFASIRMHTMSLYESGNSSGAVRLSELFGSGKVVNARSSLDYPKTVNMICRGGWPGALGLGDAAAIGISYDYIESVKKMDTSKIDGKRRSAATMELVLRSLARNSATTVSAPTITADIQGTGGKVSEQTVRSYIEALKKLFIIDEQDAWHPSIRSKTRIRASPVKHFTDPSLAAAALGARPEILMKDPKTTGFLFQSLCYRDLSVYVSAIGGRVFHYRDDSDLEVDMVIQLDDGRWGAAEIKMGTHESDKAASNLIRMKNKMVASGASEPSFLMTVNATGGGSYTRPDGVAEVPIDCLGP